MCECTFSDMPAAFRAIWRRARKPHKCYECGRVIPKGAQYEYASGIWDGNANDFKTCLRCEKARDAHEKAETKPGDTYAPPPQKVMVVVRKMFERPEYAAVRKVAEEQAKRIVGRR